MVRQFAYVHEVAVISLFIRKKNTRFSNAVFSLKTTHQTLISKQQIFYIAWAALLHGLSLEKNLIKNCNTFILDCIITWIKYN